MLFDLRSGARRRTVKIVYLGLALLMFVGFVGFSVGSSGLQGGIVDAITGSNSNSGDNTAQTRLEANVKSAETKTRATPANAAAWVGLVRSRLQLANVGDYFDSANSDFTGKGKAQLTAAGTDWDKYMALKPAKPDEDVARQMVQAYSAISQMDKAVGVQQVITEVEPTQQTFQNLAILAYQAGNIRTGDLASGKAVSLAPKKGQKDLKAQLDAYKSSAAQQQIQSLSPSPTATIAP
jgi:hypothetical protein